MKGFKISGLCSQERGTYTGLRKQRLEIVEKLGVSLKYGLDVKAASTIEWIDKEKPDLWIHHHHWMQDYRHSNYDLNRSYDIGIQPLPEIVQALSRSNCRGIIYSGTFFEPGEGGQMISAKITPYARSKHDVWEALTKWAQIHSLSVYKIIIPNPVGPLENEDRLIPEMLNHSKNKKSFALRSPWILSDYMPAETLGDVYASLALKIIQSKSAFLSPQILRPSGNISKLADWAQFVRKELFIKRLSQDLPIEIPPSTAPVAQIGHHNPEREHIEINWDYFWDQYAHWILEGKIF